VYFFSCITATPTGCHLQHNTGVAAAHRDHSAHQSHIFIITLIRINHVEWLSIETTL